MSDYTKVYDGAAKDTAESAISGADFDAEFSAIETSNNTKANKVVAGTTGNVIELSATGDLVDSGVAIADLGGISRNATPINGSGGTGGYLTVATSLPSDAERIVLTFNGIKCSTGITVMTLQLGDATSYKTATALGNTMYWSGSGNPVSGYGGTQVALTINAGAVGHYGNVILQRQDTNIWSVNGNIGNTAPGGTLINWTETGLVSALTRLRLAVTAGDINAGTVNYSVE